MTYTYICIQKYKEYNEMSKYCVKHVKETITRNLYLTSVKDVLKNQSITYIHQYIYDRYHNLRSYVMSISYPNVISLY